MFLLAVSCRSYIDRGLWSDDSGSELTRDIHHGQVTADDVLKENETM